MRHLWQQIFKKNHFKGSCRQTQLCLHSVKSTEARQTCRMFVSWNICKAHFGNILKAAMSASRSSPFLSLTGTFLLHFLAHQSYQLLKHHFWKVEASQKWQFFFNLISFLKGNCVHFTHQRLFKHHTNLFLTSHHSQRLPFSKCFC